MKIHTPFVVHAEIWREREREYNRKKKCMCDQGEWSQLSYVLPCERSLKEKKGGKKGKGTRKGS